VNRCWRVLIPTVVAAVIFSGSAAVPTVEKQPHVFLTPTDAGTLRLEAWSGRVMRGTDASGAAIPATESLSAISSPAAAPAQVKQTQAAVVLPARAPRGEVNRGVGLPGCAGGSSVRRLPG
jgi:hypothetical protein